MKGSMNDIWETRIRKEKVQKRKEKIKEKTSCICLDCFDIGGCHYNPWNCFAILYSGSGSKR
ncbi:hypothetical protein DORLON_01941 [Dorea longicatena DSM 13814]|uniref:Uncharacterized protein n=1 Tax=Dorea longicatena DSM 13814 TaxID=411462 RepID=A6BI12_9FIRM|nr:hypothetical protein DORLON_01941 [Dorea longicatena DSM 13814]